MACISRNKFNNFNDLFYILHITHFFLWLVVGAPDWWAPLCNCTCCTYLNPALIITSSSRPDPRLYYLCPESLLSKLCTIMPRCDKSVATPRLSANLWDERLQSVLPLLQLGRSAANLALVQSLVLGLHRFLPAAVSVLLLAGNLGLALCGRLECTLCILSVRHIDIWTGAFWVCLKLSVF